MPGRFGELIELGNLTQRAWEKDVQVMVEGPGHMAMDEIAANMKMEKRLCHGAPFYVLGAVGDGYRPRIRSHHVGHRRRNRGGQWRGLSVLCHPCGASAFARPLRCARRDCRLKDCRPCGGHRRRAVRGARKPDNEMAEARQRFDWDAQFRLAIDGEKAKAYYESVPASDKHSCSMCGKMCAVRTTNRILNGESVEILQNETKK